MSYFNALYEKEKSFFLFLLIINLLNFKHKKTNYFVFVLLSMESKSSDVSNISQYDSKANAYSSVGLAIYIQYVKPNKKIRFYSDFSSFLSSFFSSFFSGAMACFLDRFSLPLLSYPRDLTIISSPTLTMSLGLSTLFVSNCDTCTNPSHPGHNSTKHPKSSTFTTLPV